MNIKDESNIHHPSLSPSSLNNLSGSPTNAPLNQRQSDPLQHHQVQPSGSADRLVSGEIIAQWSSSFLLSITAALEPLHALRREVDWVPTNQLCQFPDEVVVAMLKRRCKATLGGEGGGGAALGKLSGISSGVPILADTDSKTAFITRRVSSFKGAASPPGGSAASRPTPVPSLCDRRLLPPGAVSATSSKRVAGASTATPSSTATASGSPISSLNRVASGIKKASTAVASSPTGKSTTTAPPRKTALLSRPSAATTISVGSPSGSAAANVRSTLKTLLDERKRAVKQPLTTTHITSPINSVPTTSLSSHSHATGGRQTTTSSSPISAHRTSVTAGGKVPPSATVTKTDKVPSPMQRGISRTNTNPEPLATERHVDAENSVTTTPASIPLATAQHPSTPDEGPLGAATTINSNDGLNSSIGSGSVNDTYSPILGATSGSRPRTSTIPGVARRSQSSNWDIQQKLMEVESMQQSNSVAMRSQQHQDGNEFTRNASICSEQSYAESHGGSSAQPSRIQKLKEALAAKKEARNRLEAEQARGGGIEGLAALDLAGLGDDEFLSKVDLLTTEEKRRLVDAATPRTRRRINTLKSHRQK